MFKTQNKMLKNVAYILLIALLLNAIFSMSTNVYAASKPAKVTISETSSSTDSITLKWKAVSGASTYRIDRRIDGVSEYSVHKTGLTGTSFKDTGLQAGTRYCYRVYAVNSAGTSPKPDGLWVITTPQQPSFTASGENSNSIRLQWSAVKGADTYRIDRRIDGVSEYSVYKTGLTGTSFKDTGLQAGTRYCYRVYAVNSGGTSSKPNGLWTVTTPAMPAFTVSPESSSSIRIQWSAVKGAETYRIDRRMDGVSEYSIYKTGLTGTSFTDSGLKSDTRYCYRVYAVNASGTSAKPDGNWGKTEAEATPEPEDETVRVTGVSLNRTANAIEIGKTLALVATVYPKNASDKSVKWSSSNTAVAVVSSNGVVTAKSSGTAIITVTTNDGKKTAKFTATVPNQTVRVTGVTINKSNVSIKIGETLNLAATVKPDNATNKDISWKSGDGSIAAVSDKGVVTAKKAGTTTITVTTLDGGKTAVCEVNVAPDPEPEYYIDLNGYLDGQNTNSLSGYGTADIYINSRRIADDVNDYYAKWPKGTKYEIKDIKAKSGYSYIGVKKGSLSGTIGDSEEKISLSFSKTPVVLENYYIDLNGYLNGKNANSLQEYGTVDVYINGKKVANDVNDYHVKWPVGTKYEIKDIKAKSGYTYDGVKNSSLKGTVQNGKTNIRLIFTKVLKGVDKALKWCDSKKGKKVGSGQCVAFVQAYYKYLGASPSKGNACDYAVNKLPKGWKRVKGGIPKKGDILVYTGAKYGHIVIYAGGTTIYHQNWKGKYVEKTTNWNYKKSWYSKSEDGKKSYWGYIRPVFS